jgi:hypothetical protein
MGRRPIRLKPLLPGFGNGAVCSRAVNSCSIPGSRKSGIAVPTAVSKPGAGSGGGARGPTGAVKGVGSAGSSSRAAIGKGNGNSGRRSGKRRCATSRSRWPESWQGLHPMKSRSWSRRRRARASAQPRIRQILWGSRAFGQAAMFSSPFAPVCRSSGSVAASAVRLCVACSIASHAGSVGAAGALVCGQVAVHHPSADVFVDCEPILPCLLFPCQERRKERAGPVTPAPPPFFESGAEGQCHALECR